MNFVMRNLLQIRGLVMRMLATLSLLGAVSASHGAATTSTNLGTLAPPGVYGPGGFGGTAQFAYTNYRTNEHARTIFLPRDSGDRNTIRIRSFGSGTGWTFRTISPNSRGSVSLWMSYGYIQGSSDLAMPGLDYEPVSVGFQYPASGVFDHTITIIDDDDVEFDEDIMVALFMGPTLVDIATVTIETDDPPGGANDLEFNPDPPYNDQNPNPGANGPVHAIKELDETVVLGQQQFFTNDVDIANNTITLFNHGFTNGAQVSVVSASSFNPTNGLPDGLHQAMAAQNTLFVINANPFSFRISRTSGGAAINLSSHGIGGLDPFTITEFFQRRAVFIGGEFTAVNQTPMNRIAKLFEDGSLHTNFVVGTGADGFVDDIAFQLDQKIILVGGFTSINGASRRGVARLNTDGSVDTAFNPGSGFNGPTRVAVVATNGVARGKILVGGDFTSVNSTNRNYIARLNSDGKLDPTFDPGAGPDGPVFAMKIQADGKILIGGEFRSVDGVARNRIARLNQNGGVDLSFDPGAGVDDTVFDLELDSVGNAVTLSRDAGGNDAEDRFRADTGATSGTIVINYEFLVVPDSMAVYYDGNRIFDTGLTNGNNTVEIPYGPGASTEVEIVVNEGSIGIPGTLWFYDLTIIPQGVEKVVIGGAFNTVDFRSRNGIARLHPDGSLDTGFTPGEGFNDTVFTLDQQTDGRFIVGGLFTGYNETSRTNLARLYHDGALDTSFMDSAYNQQAGPTNNSVIVRSHINDLAIQGDGKVLLGGTFTAVGGSIGRLGNGLEVGGREHVGTALGNTWPTTALNAVDDPIDYQLNLFISTNIFFTNFTALVRPREIGGSGGTRWGMRTRYNFARVHGGISANHLGEQGGPGNMGFTSLEYGEDENGTNVVLEVTRSNGRLGTISSVLSTFDESGTAGQDYGGTVDVRTWTSVHLFEGVPMFGSGDLTNKIFRVPIFEDALVEGDETVELRVSAPFGNQLLPDTITYPTISALVPTNVALGAAIAREGEARLTIFDNDFSFGNFEFSVTNFFTIEGSGRARVKVFRTGGSVGNVSVQYSTVVGGGATPGVDYISVTNTLSFAPGQTNKTFDIEVFNDTEREFDESIHLILHNPNNGATLNPNKDFATLTILDDDFGSGTISLATNTFNAAEADGSIGITIKRTSGSTGTVSVDFRTTDGTGRDGIDYSGVITNIVFGDGEIEKTVFVPILDDPNVDGNVTINLELLSPTGGSSLGVDDTATLVIANDDFYGSLQFMATDFFVNELGTNANVTVVRTGGTAGMVSAAVAIGNPAIDTAFSGSDYVGNPTVAVVFMAGETQKTFQVSIVDDGILEAEETITLTLNQEVNASLGIPSTATLTIVDDESLNRPAGSDDTFFDPGSGPDNFVFATSIQLDRRLLIGGAFESVNGTSRAKMARLNFPGSVDTSFVPGIGANDVVNAIALQPDDRILFAGAFTSYAGTNRSGVVRVLLDGTLDTTFNPGSGTDNPVLDLALNTNGAAVLVGEFSSYNGFNRNRVVLINPDGSINLAFDPGTGANDRVRAVALHTNGVYASKAVVVGDFDEINGTPVSRIARLNLADGSLDAAFTANVAAAVTNGSVHAVAIQSVDEKILIGGIFSSVNGVDRFGVARLNPDGTLDTTFDTGLGVNNTVFDIAVQGDGKIIIVGDFTSYNGIAANRITRLNSDGSLDPTINFGTGANNFISSVSIQDDAKIVIGGGFTDYNGVPRNYLTRIIGGDNAGSGLLEFAAAEFVADENGGVARITVTRSDGVDDVVSVDAAITGGTAIAGIDFDNATPLTTNLSFAIGQSFRTFDIPLLDDLNTDGDKTLSFQLNAPMNVTDGVMSPVLLGALTNANLTVRDDDSVIGFVATSYSVSEGGGTALVDVERVGGATGPVSIRFATTNDTAIAGLDYIGVTNTLSFAPGETRKTFGIPILNDDEVEGDEALNLTLFNPLGSTALGRSEVQLRIIDNDLKPGILNFSSSLYNVDENAGSATITVIRTNGTTGTVTVDYTTQDGMATAGLDYVATSGVLTFPDGVTNQTFDVFVLPDFDSGETNEALVLLLSNPQGGAVLGGQNTATLDIANNNGFVFGEFAFASDAFSVNEAAGTIDIVIERLTGKTGRVTVDLVTADDTATAGNDYEGVTNTVVFEDQVTSMSVTLTISNEVPQLAEGDETVLLTLQNPTEGSSLTTPSDATLTIVDDDFLPGTFVFEMERFDVNETFTNAVISVLRTNGVTGTVTVDYATAPGGTADPLEDYMDVAGTLTFTNGIATQTFLVPITNNPAQEGHFTVMLELSNPGGSATISQGRSILRIIDNEPAAGDPDDTFIPVSGADDIIYSVTEFEADGKIVIGGDFGSFDGQVRPNVARLNLDGTLDTFFDTVSLSLDGGPASIRSVSAVTNGVHLGKVIVGGRFDEIGGTNRVNIARLNIDGSVDTSFDVGTGPNNFVHVVAAQNDGRVVIGGEFTEVDGVARNHIARLNEDGSVDLSFDPGFGANAVVRTVAVDTSGAIVVGGDFTLFDGVSVGRVVKLRIDGTVDKTFDVGVGANGSVFSLKLIGGSGPVVMGGSFTSINGDTRMSGVARINGDGTLAAGFDSSGGPNDIVHTVSVDELERIVIGGGFTSIGSVTNVNRFARLGADGALDPTFNVGTGANGFVASSLTQSDGKVVIVGGFTKVNETTRNRIARLQGGNNVGVGNLSFETAGFTVNENELNAVVTVVRTRALSGTISVDYATSDGTALAGINYSNTTGTLTFDQSETVKSFLIPMIDNTSPFGDKTVNLTINNAMANGSPRPNLLVAPTNAVLTILDNDGVVGFASPFFSVAEDATNATISVIRDGGDIEPLTVDFAMTDGTGEVIVDYSSTNGTLSFTNGQRTATFDIPIFDDTKIEGPETINLILSNLVGNAFLSQKTAELRIIDNEFSPGFIEFESINYTTNENAVAAEIKILRTRGATGIASAEFVTSNGTAQAGIDYPHIEQPVVFADGEIETTVQIPLLQFDDLLLEGDETVNLFLSNPTGASLAGTAPFGILDTNFNFGLGASGLTARGPNGIITDTEAQADGKVIVSGAFSTWSDSAGVSFVNGIVRLLPNGDRDLSFNPGVGPNNVILDVLVQPDQNIVVAGAFTRFNTNQHERIVRLLPSGAVDTSFAAGTNANANATIRSVDIRPFDDRLLIAGDFTTYGGAAANRVALLNTDGGLNTGFNPGSGPNLPALEVMAHTRILENGRLDRGAVIGGVFNAFDGTNNVNLIARLQSNGRLDTNFHTASAGGVVGGYVSALAQTLDGRILLGGAYVSVSGATHSGIARLLNNGILDAAFDPGAAAEPGALGQLTSVEEIVVTPATNVLEQKILVGGSFSRFNGVARNRIERLNYNGSRDTTFEPCSGFDGLITDFTLQADEQLVVGGQFTMFSGQIISNLARLQPGVAVGLAMSTLTVVDNDVELGFSTNRFTAGESSGSVTVEISRIGLTNQTFNVLYRTEDGSIPSTAAAAGFDYESTSGLVTFAPGETNKTFDVTILDDTHIEGEEEVRLIVESPDNASFVGFTNAVIAILDDDDEADLSVQMSVIEPVYTNAPMTYSLIVSNAGPATLNGVSLVDTLPAGVSVASTVPANADLNTPGTVRFDLGQLAPGGAIPVEISVFAPGTAMTVDNTATVTALEIQNLNANDPDLGNNIATLTTQIRGPQAFIRPAGARVVQESETPANGAIDPGETVSLNLRLQNVGNLNTVGDVTAMIMQTATVTPGGSLTQNYGPLTTASEIVGRDFQFTANGTNGQLVVVNLMVSDGNGAIPNNLVQFPFILGGGASATNSAYIAIVEEGEALPYPSSVTISGATGFVSKVSLTLSNYTHSFPDDVDMLLVSPSGQGVVVMSDVGGGLDVNDLTLTIDDQAANALPDLSPLLGGTFRPANHHTRDESPHDYPTPAPAGPYGSSLTAFNGSDPNGVWSLYIVDDSRSDTGSIAGGWSLDITTVFAVDPSANLALKVDDSPDPIMVGSNLTYALTVTNLGPNTATNVLVVNTLPHGAQFTGATGAAAGVVSGDQVTFDFGNLAVGEAKSVAITVVPYVPGVAVNTTSVSSEQPDPAPENNNIVTETVVGAAADIEVSGLGGTVTLDTDLTYTFTVSNNGPLPATGVVMDGAIPAGLTNLQAVASQGLARVLTPTRVSATLGTLASNATATVTITARATATGTYEATADVFSALFDQNTTNNTAIAATTIVNESADIAVTLTNSPTSVAEGGRLIYTIGVINNGPSVAHNVTVTNALSVGTFIADASSEECVLSNGVVSCDLGSLPTGTNIVLTLAVVVPATPGPQADITNIVSVATTTSESAIANNQAMVTTTVLEQADVLLVGTMLKADEDLNNAIDPGETVVVAFELHNFNNASNPNVTARLLAADGVTSPTAVSDPGGAMAPGDYIAEPGGLADYGVLTRETPVARDFRFRAAGGQGDIVTATLELMDGSTSLGVVAVRFRLGEVNRYTAGAEINIPADQVDPGAQGAASPYPSVLAVTSLAGNIVSASVTISNLTHSFPDDLDILLVSPTGASVMLMSDIGGGLGLSEVTLTFDDAAASQLPDGHAASDGSRIVSGSYQPTNITDPLEGADEFPDPDGPQVAPTGPFGASMAGLVGTDPNGVWSLYVVDDNGQDHGFIADGWTLELATLVTINNQVMLSLNTLSGGMKAGEPVNINVAGRVGVTYVLEASADLQNWTPVMTNTTMNGVVTFSDGGAGQQERRFYRTIEK